jgi:hypothetical protein
MKESNPLAELTQTAIAGSYHNPMQLQTLKVVNIHFMSLAADERLL